MSDDRSLPAPTPTYCLICGDPAPCKEHTFNSFVVSDRRFMSDGTYELNAAAAAQPSAFDTGMIAGLRRELAEARQAHQRQMAERDALLARYCTTIDTQREQLADASRMLIERDQTLCELRGLIEELTAERDKLHAAYEGIGKTVGNLMAERDAWQETAAQHCRNEMYYRDLLTTIGETIGGAAYICDDGSLSDSVLRAKLPQLVADLVLGTPRADPETPRSEDAESATALSGEKSDTGHPAGGRAPMPLRALRHGDGVPR